MKQITISWDALGHCEIHFMPNAPSYRGDRKWETRLILPTEHDVANAMTRAAFQLSVAEKVSDLLNKELEQRRKEDEGEPLIDLRPGDYFTCGYHTMIRTDVVHADGGVDCVDTRTGEMHTYLGSKRVHVQD